MGMNFNQDVGVKRGSYGELGFDGGCSVMRSLLVIIGHSSTSSQKVTEDRCRLVRNVEEYYLPGVCLAFGLKAETISWLPLGSSWTIQTLQLPGCTPQATPESPKSVSPQGSPNDGDLHAGQRTGTEQEEKLQRDHKSKRVGKMVKCETMGY